jgi:NhaP-type Na+/H+ or K+/H+ antiporter
LHPVDELMVGGVQAVFLLLLVFGAVFAGLARRLKVPYPILLVIAGVLLRIVVAWVWLEVCGAVGCSSGRDDAIAATSIARRVGLPQRIVHILEAESLVNDGTGLLALQFGLAMLMTGRTPSVVEGVGRLVFLIGAGVMIGLAIGGVVALFERWVDDGPIEIVISILVP